MSNYNFADQYRIAGLDPSLEIITLRQETFDDLRNRIDHPKILDLTRLYFGLPVPNGADWFVNAFRETDATFSMIENKREASVLSVCLLAAMQEDGYAFACLAPLVASIGGTRSPLLRPEFLEESRQTLATLSVKAQQVDLTDVASIKQPVKNKQFGPLLENLETQFDHQQVEKLISLVINDTFLVSKNLRSQISKVLSPVINQVRDLRDEVSMLWWYIGGWSRTLDKPFADLDLALAALMAGIDLAHLIDGECGPLSAPAILQRLIFGTSKAKDDSIALKSVVETLPSGAYRKLNIPSSISSASDLCPISLALSKAEEVGGDGAWHKPFTKASGLQPTLKLPPLELAMQIYRETLLLKQLG